jgi:hypothetical protein
MAYGKERTRPSRDSGWTVHRTYQLPSQRRSDFQPNTSNPALKAHASPSSRSPHTSTYIHHLHQVSHAPCGASGTRGLTFGILNAGDQVTFSERSHDFIDTSITQTGDLDDEGGWHDFVVLGANFDL